MPVATTWNSALNNERTKKDAVEFSKQNPLYKILETNTPVKHSIRKLRNLECFFKLFNSFRIDTRSNPSSIDNI